MQPTALENMPGNTDATGAPVTQPQAASNVAQGGAAAASQVEASANPAPNVELTSAQAPQNTTPAAAANPGQPQSLATNGPVAGKQQDVHVPANQAQDTGPAVVSNPEQNANMAHQQAVGAQGAMNTATEMAGKEQHQVEAHADSPKVNVQPAAENVAMDARYSSHQSSPGNAIAPSLDGSVPEQDQNKKLQNQSLWGKAAPANGNVPMASNAGSDDDDDDESKFSIDDDLREQCEKLQTSEGLFNLDANIYQVAILNGKLAAFNMRLDFNESVLATITKRRKEEAVREKEMRKRLQKEARVKAQTQKRHEARIAKIKSKKDVSPSESSYAASYSKRQQSVSISAAPAQMMSRQPTEIIKEDSATDEVLDKSPRNSEPALDTQFQPESSSAKKGLEPTALNETETKDVTAGAQVTENLAKAETEQPSAPVGAMDDLPKFEQKFTSQMDSSGLSPTPRKSERSKSAINYKQWASGYKDPLSDLDEHLAQTSKSKKLDNEKRIQVEETRNAVEELFKKLLTHEAADVLNQPLDKTNPRYDEFKNRFKNLIIIEMTFKTGQYNSTQEIIKDVETMLCQQYNLLAAVGSPNFAKVKQFSEFFYNECGPLKDLTLVVPKTKPDSKKPPPHRQPQPITSRPAPKPKPESKKRPEDDGFRFKDVAEKDALGKDIQQLDNNQKQTICEQFPEFVTYDDKNAKTLTLGLLPRHPEQARKLVNYVKDQIKKNHQRKRRQQQDKARREQKQREKAAADAATKQPNAPAGTATEARAPDTANQANNLNAVVQLANLLQQQNNSQPSGLQQQVALLANFLNAQGNSKDGAGGLPNANALLAAPNPLQLQHLLQTQTGANNTALLSQASQLQQLLAGQSQGTTATLEKQAAKKGKGDGAGQQAAKDDSSSSESESD